MGTTRIRWRNVARLAAGAAIASLLIVLVGSMLKPKPPQPLPDDVGLGDVTGHAVAYAPPRSHPGHAEEQPDPAPARERPEHAEKRQAGGQPHDHSSQPPRAGEPESHRIPPAPSPAAPTAAPAPAPVPPPPAPEPPPTHEEPPDAAPHQPEPSATSDPDGPSQFGFER